MPETHEFMKSIQKKVDAGTRLTADEKAGVAQIKAIEKKAGKAPTPEGQRATFEFAGLEFKGTNDGKIVAINPHDTAKNRLKKDLEERDEAWNSV